MPQCPISSQECCHLHLCHTISGRRGGQEKYRREHGCVILLWYSFLPRQSLPRSKDSLKSYLVVRSKNAEFVNELQCHHRSSHKWLNQNAVCSCRAGRRHQSHWKWAVHRGGSSCSAYATAQASGAGSGVNTAQQPPLQCAAGKWDKHRTVPTTPVWPNVSEI